MHLILYPKDNSNPMDLQGVTGFALEGETLLVIFEDGRTRNYPLLHIDRYDSFLEDVGSRDEEMTLILSRKSDLNKISLSEVLDFSIQGQTLNVVFSGGNTSNYPLMHLWYYESHVGFHKTEPMLEQ